MMEAARAGEAPIPGDPDPEEEVERREEVVLEGDGQLTLAVGGRQPNISKVVLRGGQIPFNGQAKKGARLTLEVECVVGEIHLIDTRDSKTQEIVETTRKHVLKVRGARIVKGLESADEE